ncbi:MAG: fibronectin type III domain-containing protein [Candidatus Thermoplasmatota archaeon]|nr:fibronectin type III domain-containing protein [Candidatus Thermoplasmatota archaeon]
MSRALSICPILIVALFSMTLSSITSAGSGEDSTLHVPAGTVNTATYPDPGFFSENLGQLENREVFFTGSSNMGAVLFLKDGIILRIPDRTAPVELYDEGTENLGPLGCTEDYDRTTRSSTLKISFNDPNMVVPEGREVLPFCSNFFLGNDPESWRTGVRNFREIIYENVWDDVDIVYRTGEKGLKYDVILHPGSDHEEVRFKVEGSSVSLGKDGTELGIASDSGPVIYDSGLEVYYEGDPLERLTSRFNVHGDTYSFELERRDPSRTVIIDPLIYSTYIGSTGWEEGWDMDVDDEGCTYLTRHTESADFPTTEGSYDTSFNGGDWDVFVVKLSESGDSLIYSTYLGGTGLDTGVAITVDRYGYAYIGGVTDSVDLPTTAGAFDTVHDRTDKEMFAVKLGLDGASLQYSTYIGGGKDDAVHRIVVDEDGALYLTGMTGSTDLPVTAGSYDVTYNGGVSDTFAAKLSPGGNTLEYCTYIGGDGEESSNGIDIDYKGCIYLFGEVSSRDFPTTEHAFNRDHNGGEMDLFVTKLDPSGSSLIFSTFLGGGKNEQAQSIRVDDDGYAYLTGATNSGGFPVTERAFDRSHNGGKDAIVIKLNVSGDMLVYSTFIGDEDDEIGYGVDVDHEGYAYIVGVTGSRNFPVSDFPLYRTARGGVDSFVLKLSRDGNSIRYSTYFGGNGDDVGSDISCDRNSCAIIIGTTTSRNLPTTDGSFQDTYAGGLYDIFTSKLNVSTLPTAPRSPKTVFGDSMIELSWLEPMDAGGPAQVFYNIYRGETPLGIAYLTTVSETIFNDTELTNGVTYYYRVSAENDMGEGGFSNEVSATPGRIPDAPLDLEAVPGNNNVSLSWRPPEDDGGFPIAWYDVFRGTVSSDLKMIFRVHDGESHFDETVTNGITYYYQVTALNKVGQGPPSSLVSAMPSYNPSAPRELLAVATPGRVNLSWEAPLSDGGLGIDGYIVYRRALSGEMEPITETMDLLYYHDTGLKNGVTYYYQVRAVNSFGIGKWSPEAFATPITLPTEPRNFSATHGNLIVILTWLPPETDGGSNITRYDIYKGRDPGSLSFLAKVVEGQRYEDKDVRNGFTYHYSIRAFTKIGSSPWSDVISETPRTIPSSPSYLSAALDGKKIELVWRPPYTDGGADINEYRIYRGSSADNLKYYASVGTSLNFTDDNITGDGGYYYRVSALNSEGEGERSKEAKVIITSWDPPESSAIMNILALWWIIIPALLISMVIASLGILTYRYRETWKDDGKPNFIKMFKQLRIDLKK